MSPFFLPLPAAILLGTATGPAAVDDVPAVSWESPGLIAAKLLAVLHNAVVAWNTVQIGHARARLRARPGSAWPRPWIICGKATRWSSGGWTGSAAPSRTSSRRSANSKRRGGAFAA